MDEPRSTRGSFYDEAPYDRNYDPLQGRQQTDNPSIKKLTEFHAGKTILDIGCGCGHNLFIAAQYAALAIGLDYSGTSVQLAGQRLPKDKVCLLQCDNLNLSFPPEFADLVISDGVIHHTGDTQKAFRECVRVLKPGGHLYLAVYTKGSFYQWLYTYVGGALRILKRVPRGGQSLIENFFVPLHYLLYYIKYLRRKNNLTMQTTRSVFYDYFLTPVATFQSKDTVMLWIRQNNCFVESYTRVKFSHHFIIKKPVKF